MARRKSRWLVLLTVLLLTLSTGLAGAYLQHRTQTERNVFLKSDVDVTVTEYFSDNVKSNVNVINTGNVTAYFRVRLVTYRVNAAGIHIGGTAAIPNFELGDGWEKWGAYYYYRYPVLPGESPQFPLIGTPGIALVDYEDADGGRQVIEVMAEAIQALPSEAVVESWEGVTAVKDGALVIGEVST